jgi:hypothetical protein
MKNRMARSRVREPCMARPSSMSARVTGGIIAPFVLYARGKISRYDCVVLARKRDLSLLKEQGFFDRV